MNEKEGVKTPSLSLLPNGFVSGKGEQTLTGVGAKHRIPRRVGYKENSFCAGVGEGERI